MGASGILNKVARILLLTCVGLVLLLYILGIVANAFGLMEMRRSDHKILQLLKASADIRAIVSQIPYQDGVISYAGVTSSSDIDSIAVIFVHGSPGSMDAYTSYLLDVHLQSHAALYTYDRLGYGNSSIGNQGVSLVPQSEQLYAFTKSIGSRRNIFVGHSLGCSIIARLAIDHPEVVNGLVMVAAPLDPSLEPSSWWRPMLNFPMISIAIPHALHVSNNELRPLKKDLEACVGLWDRITCPVLFVHGDLDSLVPIENVTYGKRVLVNASVSEHIVPRAGHLMLWSDKDLIADDIIRMIESIDSK